jgi:hypothetical protein
LLYSNRIDSVCFAESYEAVFDYPLPSIDWHDYPHVTDHTIFGTIFNEQFNRLVTEEELDKFQTDFVERMQRRRVETPEEFKEVPGARQTIDNLLNDERYSTKWRPSCLRKRRRDAYFTGLF